MKRVQQVEGTHNLRDVGGYRTSAGVTRWGTLFRSDGLHQLSNSGLTALGTLGIGGVIDLRDDRERHHQPDRLPEGVVLIEHPIFPSALAHVAERMNIFTLTENIYLEHAPRTVDALRVIAAQDSPTLVHCTAGKDRTGAVIALALTAVGVDRDDVYADYAATEALLRGPWLDEHLAALKTLGLEITDDVLGLVSTSPVEAIERAMQRIDTEYGSVTQYLRVHGINDAILARLHERLVM